MSITELSATVSTAVMERIRLGLLPPIYTEVWQMTNYLFIFQGLQ